MRVSARQPARYPACLALPFARIPITTHPRANRTQQTNHLASAGELKVAIASAHSNETRPKERQNVAERVLFRFFVSRNRLVKRAADLSIRPIHTRPRARLPLSRRRAGQTASQGVRNIEVPGGELRTADQQTGADPGGLARRVRH